MLGVVGLTGVSMAKMIVFLVRMAKQTRLVNSLENLGKHLNINLIESPMII